MLLLTHGLDLYDGTLILEYDVVKDAEILDAKFPIGQLVLGQSLPVPCFLCRLFSQLRFNGV